MNERPVMRRRFFWLTVLVALGAGWGLVGRALGCNPAW